VGLASLTSAFLAVCSAIAGLIYVQYPYLHMVLIMPFLIISIGVDNSFLMLKNWRIHYAETRAKGGGASSNSDEVLVRAVTEVSVYVFITFLTDGLSFAIGTTSDFLAVRVFCTYCATAILFLFLYQFTFFLALMSLYCGREANGRHWLLCRQVNPRTRGLGKKIEESSSRLCKNYAFFLRRASVKYFILLTYLAYLAFSVTWIFRLRLGRDS